MHGPLNVKSKVILFDFKALHFQRGV